MIIHFLVEDSPGGKLIEEIMKKYKAQHNVKEIIHDIRPYHGIGKFEKGSDAKTNKSRLLLNELPKRIRAYHYSHLTDKDVAVFIIVDNDDRIINDFRQQLESVVTDKSITIDRVFCIAVEEIEAWLLGDVSAVINAYPELQDRIQQKIHGYKQDEIREGGTWEFLYDILQHKNKKKPDSDNIGKMKTEWAEKIGLHMNIRENASPSFNCLINELDKRLILKTASS